MTAYILISALSILKIQVYKYSKRKIILKILQGMFYTIQICSFLEGNILSSSTKNTKTCSSHLHEASNKHKHPLGLMNLPFSFAHYRNVLSCPFKVKHQLFDPKASVTLKYLQQGLWLNLLFLSVGISLSIFFGQLKFVGTLWSIYAKTCW